MAAPWKTWSVPVFPIAAFLAGAAAVLGFSPLDLFPALLLALAVLVHLWVRAATPRAAFLAGFLFGLGFFLAGVSWVYVSLHRFGGMPAPLAAFATLGFCAFLALFPAIAGWTQARLLPPALRPLAIPAFWVLAEWLRGEILTGFPWLAIGYAAVDTPLAGYAPLGGVHFVSLATMTAAALLWLVAAGLARWRAAAAFAVLGLAGAWLQGVPWTAPAGKPVSASLLQGNVPQSLKFDPDRYDRTLATYLRLAEASRARLIVLPETAIPRFLDLVDPAYVAALKSVAVRNGGDLLLGVPVRNAPGDFRNSVVSLGVSPSARYDKSHLVPFGEFVPPGFGWILGVLRIPMSDFTRGSLSPRALAVAGERVAVNICY
jgi:apolipoprotein N-acyltransferase